MIIDLILDRYDGDAYDPKEFYDRVMEYEEGTDYPISTALDGGEEEDIRRELCAYIDDGNYNPKIKDFINSVKWLDGDDGKDYSKVFNILGESKKRFECSMQKKVESFKKNETLGMGDDLVLIYNLKKKGIVPVVEYPRNGGKPGHSYRLFFDANKFGEPTKENVLNTIGISNKDANVTSIRTWTVDDYIKSGSYGGVVELGLEHDLKDNGLDNIVVAEVSFDIDSNKDSTITLESKKSESSDEQIEHGDSCHIFIEDEPNFQVSFRDENDKEYTFYVNAENVDSAIDSAYHEFSLNHGLSIKGEVSLEDDIPAGERNNYIEVNTNYAPKVNIAADPYDGSGIRVTRVPDYLLPAFVNGDTSGLEDEDLDSLEELEKELEAEGINPSLTFPVCGPDGEYWDNDEFGDGVLCSARV